jgi:hypothetical protein
MRIAQGAGEGATDVAEELAFQQLAGKCAAVDGDESSLPARRMEVQGPRHQLFAGAALAAQKDRRLAGCSKIDR